MADRLLCIVLLLVTSLAARNARADIYRWDNGQLIPGTEGITPGSGVQLDYRQLEFAALNNIDLSNSSFGWSNLRHANMSRTNLRNSGLIFASLSNANMDGARIEGAHLFGTTENGFSAQQLYSTASYRQGTLQGVRLGGNDLSGWDFSGQDLSNSDLFNLGRGAGSGAVLANTNFTNAIIRGAVFTGVTTGGFTKEQLYSTASYKSKDLTNVTLDRNDLSTWDFSDQNIAGASFAQSNITKEQLYSTASYKTKNMQSIGLGGTDLTLITLSGIDLSGARFTKFLPPGGYVGATLAEAAFIEANLVGASMMGCTLRNADFSGAHLQNADLQSSDLAGVNFSGAALAGANLSNSNVGSASFVNAIVEGAGLAALRDLTKDQLYSTLSYQTNSLRGVSLSGNDLRGWDFTSQNLEFANLAYANMVGARLENATIRGALFRDSSPLSPTNIVKEQIYATASYEKKDLSGIDLSGVIVIGWNLAGQNLMDSKFDYVPSDLKFADLRGFRGPDIHALRELKNVIRRDGTLDLTIMPGETFVLRDDDGVLDPAPASWLTPRVAIPVIVEQQMVVMESGVLQLAFDADPWGSLISFEPGIPVHLGGTLELTFAADVNVATQVGRTLRIFDWTGVSPVGAFTVYSPYSWDVSRLYTTGEVTLTAVPEPATFVLASLALAPLAWLRCARSRTDNALRCSGPMVRGTMMA